MSVVRAPVADLAPGPRTLDPATAHYLLRVLRLGRGTHFVAFDPIHALEADAEIVSADPATAVFGPTRPARVVAPRDLTLIQALAKGALCDAVVRDATELGVTHIVVSATARSVVQLDPARARARRERWLKIAREAARQSGRADAPSVEGPVPWPEALDAAPAAAARFVLDGAAPAPLGPALLEALAAGVPLAIAVGPEGGLTEEEIDAARSKGWRPASLGELVLRTETVAAAVLGAAYVYSASTR
jgi:16S rRNA (uracil1498-N3)-methyltransferase